MTYFISLHHLLILSEPFGGVPRKILLPSEYKTSSWGLLESRTSPEKNNIRHTFDIFEQYRIPCTRLDPQCRQIHDLGPMDLAPLFQLGPMGRAMFHSIDNIAPGP